VRTLTSLHMSSSPKREGERDRHERQDDYLPRLPERHIILTIGDFRAPPITKPAPRSPSQALEPAHDRRWAGDPGAAGNRLDAGPLFSGMAQFLHTAAAAPAAGEGSSGLSTTHAIGIRRTCGASRLSVISSIVRSRRASFVRVSSRMIGQLGSSSPERALNLGLRGKPW
jgi:hypothetical protein